MFKKLYFKLSVIFAALVVLIVILILALPAGIRWGGQKWLRDQGLEAEIDEVELDLSEGWLAVNGAKGRASDGAGFDLRRLRVTWRWNTLWDKEVRIAGIEVDGLTIDAARDGEGVLQVGGLKIPPPGAAEPAATPPPPGEPSEWRYRLDDVSVSDLHACYRDAGLAQRTEVAVRGFAETCTSWTSLEWRGESLVGPLPGTADQPLPWQASGTLQWRGLAVAAPGESVPRFAFATLSIQQLRAAQGVTAAAAQVAVEGLRLADPLHEPHLADWITLGRIALGELELTTADSVTLGSVQLETVKVLQTQGAYAGQVMAEVAALDLASLRLEELTGARKLGVEKVTVRSVRALKRRAPDEDAPAYVAALESLELETLAAPEPTTLSIGKLRLQKPEVWLARDSEGTWELVDWFAKPAQEETPSDAPPGEAIKLLIGELQLTGDGAITLDDRKVTPPYRETISGIGLVMGNIDNTAPGTASPLTVEAAIGEHGKLELTGEIKPFAARPDLKLAGTLSGVDLGPVTSYARDAVQHRIRQGSLDAELNIKIEQGMLDSTVELELHKLALEPLSEEELAGAAEKELGIPLNAALSLLRDKDDAIRLNLPVAGDVASPDISVGNVLGKVMGKAIKSAVVAYYSPFGLLKLAGAVLDLATGLRFEPVPFEPGQIELTAAARKSLSDIATLLKERPQVRLVLCGDVTRADFDQLFPPPPPQPAPAPPAAAPAVQGQGTAASTPPPAPAAPPAPRMPDAEQAKALWEVAAKRGQAVKNYLVKESGVEAKRLIVCNPEQVLKEETSAVVEISI